ncbi:MAG: methionine--tRNA ligase [Nitrososphaera sp.]|jgi:methionine--tRNA ligase beta chain
MSEQGGHDVITFDEFIKVQLKIGKVASAEAIPGMKKVFKAVVDIGTEKREVAVGAALWIKPEDFVGRTVVICTNLAPRKIGDMTSNGMLLAADGPEGKPVFLTVAEEAPLGAPIH